MNYPLVQKLVSFFLSFVSLFITVKGGQWADSAEGYDFPRIGVTEQEEGTVRVLSFNVRVGDVNGVEQKKRRNIVERQINEIMPDSFGVQEANRPWMKKLALMLPQYGHVGVDRDTGKKRGKGEYAAVFYLKAKYKVVDSGNFWLSETPDEPSYGPGAAYKRVCTWVILMNRSTKQKYVHINTHFDHVSEDARVLAGEYVNNYIKNKFEGLPVVFTADMNTTSDGAAYAKMTENLCDARLAAEDCMSYGTFHGLNPAGHADYDIDFILCSPQITVKTYRTVTEGIDGRFVSDHFPIYADIVIPS